MNQQVFTYAGKLYDYPVGNFLRDVTVEEEKLINKIGRMKSFISNSHGSIIARVVTLPSNNG